MAENDNRNHAVDFIKGLSLVLIAAMHMGLFSEISPEANFVLNTAMRYAVPFFFIASGYLLFGKLKKGGAPSRGLARYSARIGAYYLAASAACFGLPLLAFGPGGMSWNMEWATFKTGFAWLDFLYYGIDSKTGFHLWYLVALFWASLVLMAACRKDVRAVKGVLVAAAVLHAAGLFGQTQPWSKFFLLPFYPRDGLFFALFYVSLGGYWAVYGSDARRLVPRALVLPGIALFSLLQLAERSLLLFAYRPQADWGATGGEYFLTTLPLAALVFRYALDNPGRFAKNPLTRLGEDTLGVYVVHAMAIEVLWIAVDAASLWGPAMSLPGQILLPFVVVAASWLAWKPFSAASAALRRASRARRAVA